MNFEINEDLFKELTPFLIDHNVTDIKWNGHNLWIEDLNKGRYKSNIILSDDYLKILTTRLAAYGNVNFNASSFHLQISLHDLRIHALHPFFCENNQYVLAIRKTPAIARLTSDNIIKSEYADKITLKLLEALIKCHISGIIIGESGAGKTELQKFLVSFIVNHETLISIEDTYEMHLSSLYPDKDIASIKTDEHYTTALAIKDSLRLIVRYLWIAESRSREIAYVLEGASSGCCVWTSIHCENVWDISDRIVAMSGKNLESSRDNIENDTFTFFNVGIKINKTITNQGVKRKITQICFLERKDKENITTIFMKDGCYTKKKLPAFLADKFLENKQYEILNLLKGENLL